MPTWQLVSLSTVSQKALYTGNERFTWEGHLLLLMERLLPPWLFTMLFASEHPEKRIKSFQGRPKQNQHLPKPWPVTSGKQCQMHPTSWLWLCLPLCCKEWQVQFSRTQALKWVAEIHLTFRDLAIFSQTRVLEVSMLWFSKTQRYNNEYRCAHCLRRTQWERMRNYQAILATQQKWWRVTGRNLGVKVEQEMPFVSSSSFLTDLKLEV